MLILPAKSPEECHQPDRRTARQVEWRIVVANERIVLAALGALLVYGCGSDDSPSLTHYATELSDGVDAVDASLAEHHERVLALTDLEQIHALERQHVHDMTATMARVWDATDSIEACSERMTMGRHAGEAGLLEADHDVANAMDDVSAEVDRHFEAMQSAADLDSALAEEHHHQSALGPLMEHMHSGDQDTMHVMWQMENTGDSMMCAMGTHMHHGM